MFSSIKMDFYRMFRTKSFYGVLLAAIISIAFTTYLEIIASGDEQIQADKQMADQEAMKDPKPENVNFGMAVSLTALPGEKITVYDMFYANTNGKFTAVFLIIFTVIFTMADITSGYIKNIAGQIRNRWWLMISKACVIFVYTIIVLGIFIFWQAICNQIFFGYIIWGDGKQFLLCFLAQGLLHFAFAMISMMIAVIVKNQVFSMTVCLCLCMNLMVIIYGVVDKVVQKLGKQDFSCIAYTITGKMSLLPQDITGKDSIGAIGIAFIFAAAAIFITSIVFEKRDI